jgi:hypothetical protein
VRLTNSQKLEIDFWYEFDKYFHAEPPQEVIDAENALPDLRNLFVNHRRNGTYPSGFISDITPSRDPIMFLANRQLDMFSKYFHGDTEIERGSFEDFGQGVLFDDRRSPPDKIHKMDGGRNNPPIGYHRWHGFIRAVVFLGGDTSRWLQMDRNVGLAWDIQSILQPPDDVPNNPRLSSTRLEQLRSLWSIRSFDELDNAFDSFPFPSDRM